MIDVIIPVYSGEEHVRRCIASVLHSATNTRFELIVVDDCSPEPDLSAWLRESAAKGRFTLLVNEANQGFVGSVNRALAMHSERDAVILNSDTEVAGDWLDRLQRCAASAPDIATVTPFSNNGTICSYPFEGWSGGVPGRLGLSALDALFSKTLEGIVIDLPTAVGFCMYLRRACIDQIGAFDVEAFGRGYGEENDYSLRAAKAGWRNVLCASVFVYHCGGVSFGSERTALMHRAAQVLNERHPDYVDRVEAFRRANPLAPLFAVVDRERRAVGVREAEAVFMERAEEHLRLGIHRRIEAPRPRPVTLHIVHSWGGGVERWVRDYAAADPTGWNLLLRSRPDRNNVGIRLELIDVLVGEEGALAWDLSPAIASTAIAHTHYQEILGAVIASFGVEAIIVSSLIGHALDAIETGLPTAVVLHDLYPYCPALFGWFDGPCNRCERNELSRCLQSNKHNVFWQHDDVDAWLSLREAYADRIQATNVHVFAPSHAVYERYAVLFPALARKPWSLVPHGVAQYSPNAGAELEGVSQPTVTGHRLRVLIPGRLSPHKGLHLFIEILSALHETADFMLLGAGNFGAAFEGVKHVEVVREFADDSLASHVRDFAPDCALLLSVLPESFSYTLSEMFALGVPVVATRLGAFAERIQDGVNGILVAPNAEAIIDCLRRLDGDRARLAAIASGLKTHRETTPAEMVFAYRRALGLQLTPTAQPVADMTRMLLDALHRANVERKWLHDECRRLQREMQSILTRERELASRLERMTLESTTSCGDQELLRRRLWVLERQLEAMLTSRSWRVTSLFRQLSESLLGNAPALSEPGEIRVEQMNSQSDSIKDRAEEHTSKPDSASENATPSARRIVFRSSDPLVERRARLIGKTLAMPCVPDDSISVEQSDSVSSRDLLPPGFAGCMSVVFPTDGGPKSFECVTWFEGVDCQESSTEDWFVAVNKVRVMVPSDAVRDRFYRTHPASKAELQRCDFPLAGDWSHIGSRSRVRDDRREALGVPDRSRLVVGIGALTEKDGFSQFAQVARETSRMRNDLRFLWLGRGGDNWIRDNLAELAEPVGTSRLFVLEGEAFEAWLLAADVYLGCRADGVYDGGAVEAAAVGLPVVVVSAGSLPDVLNGDLRSDQITVCSTPDTLGVCVVEAAGAVNQESAGGYQDSANRVRAHFGSEAVRAAFVRMCSGERF